jgi:hypothetical protein
MDNITVEGTKSLKHSMRWTAPELLDEECGMCDHLRRTEAIEEG